MLHLNRTKIKGSDLKISATLPLAGEDLSGQSSYATQAETGDKPQQLSVRMLITFKNSADLTELVTLAKAKNSSGERLTYDVLNDTAQAMAIRQVRFQGDLTVSEDETTRSWSVGFKLIEVKSVAEVKEARQQTQAVTDQAPTGETVTPVDTVTPKAEELSSFESVLSWMETQVTPSETA
tara:strand:+ start:99460 stop:99999 length:540 start_codon:yes stop_codon:yes gene_type:complete